MEEKMNKEEYFELHKHKGTENYEVKGLINEDFKIPNILLDQKEKNIISYAFKENELDGREFYMIRVSKFGNIIEKGKSYRILKDGTLWWYDFYCNRVINGDKTEYKYLDPFSEKKIDDTFIFTLPEVDPQKWLNKFQETYKKASYIYIYSGCYYFRIDDKWYFIKELNWEQRRKIGIENFEKKYPAKETDIRMLELEDIMPDVTVPLQERDTGLVEKVDFDATYIKKRKGFGIRPSSTYAAGWWYLNIKMPGGDIIKMKHYSPYFDPGVYLYRIPEEYEGRTDVLFVIQEPNSMFTEQAAGMYVIRPRNYKESEDYKETCSRQ